jgi:hypothetical protein
MNLDANQFKTPDLRSSRQKDYENKEGLEARLRARRWGKRN